MSALGMAIYENPNFARYFDQRKHIWIEQMDSVKDVKAVQKWIDEGRDFSEKKERFNFLFYHIDETEGIFDWHFKQDMFTIWVTNLKGHKLQ